MIHSGVPAGKPSRHGPSKSWRKPELAQEAPTLPTDASDAGVGQAFVLIRRICARCSTDTASPWPSSTRTAPAAFAPVRPCAAPPSCAPEAIPISTCAATARPRRRPSHPHGRAPRRCRHAQCYARARPTRRRAGARRNRRSRLRLHLFHKLTVQAADRTDFRARSPRHSNNGDILATETRDRGSRTGQEADRVNQAARPTCPAGDLAKLTELGPSSGEDKEHVGN
jgi:hypothetical protein